MKRNALFILLMTVLSCQIFAQIKCGITNFSVNGYVRGNSIGSSNEKEPDLNFIASSTTRMGDSLVSNMMITLAETEIGKFLGCNMYPVSRSRNANVPDVMNGTLWVMETTTEKKAFKELGYDKIVTLSVSINYRSMKTVKGTRMYTPAMTLSIKVINKEGKTEFKKNETLVFKEDLISGSLIEEKSGDGEISISFKDLKTVSVNTGADTEAKGIAPMQLMNWFQQVLGNALIKD